ncbi:MAG: Dabb family protein [Chthoniobacter sp.]|nr:Dabb family protein [Chthoniobacter sp.]
MFSHVVIFWTKPELPEAADALIAGAEKYLRPIPLAKSFHIGRMVPSHRPVVDQSYQVGLHLLFEDKAAEAAYQVHPLHVEFVEKVFKPNCARATIFDFA